MTDKCDLPWEEITSVTCPKDEDTLEEFAKKLAENQEPLDPEFQKTLDEHYWDLLGGKKITGPTGWICPVCGRGNAPYTSSCPCIPPPPMKVTC